MTKNPIIIGFAGGQRIYNTKECDILVLLELIINTRKAHILPGLMNRKIIGISPLVYHVCNVIFNI